MKELRDILSAKNKKPPLEQQARGMIQSIQNQGGNKNE